MENIKDYLPFITIAISSIAAFFAYNSWQINKTKLAIDELNIMNEFYSGISALKEIHAIAAEIKINTHAEYSEENRRTDMQTLIKLISELNSKEDKLKKLFLPLESVYTVAEAAENHRKTLEMFSSRNDFSEIENYYKFKSSLSRLFFSLAFLSPSGTPRTIPEGYTKEKLKNEYFLERWSKML